MALASTKESGKQSKQMNEIEIICYNCNKLFKTSYVYRNYYCSEKCKLLAKEKQKLAEQRRIEIEIHTRIRQEIPPKYISIESDFKNINSLMGKSLYITGDVGVGKTVLMTTLIKNYLRQQKKATCISYPKFIMTLQGMFKNPDKDPYGYAEDIANYEGVLAIDDLGAEKLTEFVRQITYFIINEREQNVKTTIITSNYTLQQVDEMIDPRVSSRIAGNYEIKKLQGKDRRLK